MELKKASLEGRLVDVISFDKLKENKELYTTTSTAAGIEVDTSTGESFVLPFKDKGSPINDRAGVYTIGNVGYLIKYPDKRYKSEY